MLNGGLISTARLPILVFRSVEYPARIKVAHYPPCPASLLAAMRRAFSRESMFVAGRRPGSSSLNRRWASDCPASFLKMKPPILRAYPRSNLRQGNDLLTTVSPRCGGNPVTATMALIDRKAERGGWQHQAQRLAVVHTSAVTTAMAATEQALRPSLQAVLYHQQKRPPQRETSKIKPRDFKPTRAELAELERQGARETAAESVRNARRETLAARAAQADERIAKLEKLESDLSSAHEQIALLENENHSLRSSLDLTVSENSRLSHRLTESEAACTLLKEMKASLMSVQADRDELAAAEDETHRKLEQTVGMLATTEAEGVKLSLTIDETRSKLEQMKVELARARAERVTLSFAVDEVNNKRQAETFMLNARLGAMAERAITAERGLAGAQQKLLARTAENCSVERKLADATFARDAAYKELDLLQKMLHAREGQVWELLRSRSELIEITTTLLRAFKNRSKRRAEDEIAR